jgi:hypothetical protein
MVKTTNAVSLNLLPEKLKERYIMAYENLLKMRKIYKTKSLSENMFLSNFNKLSTEIKPSTLCSTYLMLKSLKNLKHYITIVLI